MELNQLRYFYVVAQEASFTRAARILRIQQPTISKMVKALEESLGLVLFERHKRGVRLTKSGGDVLRHCEELFGQVDAIVALSHQEKTECQGLLSFAITDSVSRYVLPRFLRGFLERHPKVRPSIFAGSYNLICNEINEGRVEFGIFYTDPRSQDYDVTEITKVPFRLVVSASHARKPGIKLSFIISRDIDYPKARPFPVLEMLRKAKVPVNVVMTSNNLDAQKEMVLQGLGVALLPGFMLRSELERGSLMEVYPKLEFIHSLRLATRRRKILSKNAATFVEEFKAAAAQLVADSK
jgi:DNA-binding transcriptional LysR family regulator